MLTSRLFQALKRTDVNERLMSCTEQNYERGFKYRLNLDGTDRAIQRKKKLTCVLRAPDDPEERQQLCSTIDLIQDTRIEKMNMQGVQKEV